MIGISDNKATAVTATTTMILPYPSSYHPLLRTSHNKPHARHRSKIDILNQILVAVSSQSPDGNGAAKTRIMYQTELSWTQLRKYISQLIANELLTCRPASQSEINDNPNVKQFYMITTKAKIFLKLYNSMHSEDLLYGISRSGADGGRKRLLQDYQREEKGGAT